MIQNIFRISKKSNNKNKFDLNQFKTIEYGV